MLEITFKSKHLYLRFHLVSFFYLTTLIYILKERDLYSREREISISREK